jgi:hypothetical protein
MGFEKNDEIVMTTKDTTFGENMTILEKTYESSNED